MIKWEKKVKKIENFFIDIDGTITDSIKEKPVPEESLVCGNPIFGVIRDIMVEEGWNQKEAKEKIEEYAERVIWWDYPDFIAEFNLPIERTWKAIEKWHEDYLLCYEDSVEMVKELFRQKKKLFIVSNNPIVGCLLKLKRAGLGNITGSPYFNRILGANILRGQKHQPELWKKAISQVGLNPKTIASIGNNLKEDSEVPLSCGIGYAFIIQRDLSKDVVFHSKTILVKSPDCIPQLIKK